MLRLLLYANESSVENLYRKLYSLIWCRVPDTMRHGPVPPGRRMFDVSAEETIALAAGHGLSAHHLVTREDMLDRADVHWSFLGLKRG